MQRLPPAISRTSPQTMASRFVSSPEAQPFMKPHHVTVDCSAAAEAPSAPVRSALTLPLLAVAAAAAVLWGGVHWGGSPVASQLHTRPAATARTVRAARPSHTPSGLLRPVRAVCLVRRIPRPCEPSAHTT